MRKATFWVGISGLMIWLLWFLIQSAPIFYISEEVLNLLLHILFVLVCLFLIVFGICGKEKNKK